MITMIQIYFDSYAFCTSLSLISCHLVFFFESISWCKREKKQENSSECFTYGLEKTLIYFTSSPKSPQFCSNLAILYELLKVQRINYNFLRKLIEWCHWYATCMPLIHLKSNNMLTWFFVLRWCTSPPSQYITWIVFFQ